MSAEQTIKSPEFTMLNREPIPLVKPLINELNNLGINFSPYDSHGLSLSFDEDYTMKYLLSRTTRNLGDQTGFLCHLLGVSKDKQDTKDIVVRIGNGLIQTLVSNPQYADFESVASVLDGEKTPNLQDLRTIDVLTGLAVGSVKAVAQERGLAEARYDDATYDAWLFREFSKLQIKSLAKAKGGLKRLLNRESITDSSGNILNIFQTLVVPLVDVRELRAILPDELNRNINLHAPLVSDDNIFGLLARLNMFGSDVARYLIRLANDKIASQKIIEHISSSF